MTAAGLDQGTEAADVGPDAPRPRSSLVRVALLSFWVPLLVVAALGVGLRLAVVEATPSCGAEQALDSGCLSTRTDSFEYALVARALADGGGYTGLDEERAHHPPGYSTYLAGWAAIGVDGYLGLRRASSLLGAAAIVVAAVVARHLGGARVGLVAGLIVALHPALWINDVVLMSESLYQVVVAAVMWAGYRLWVRRSLGAAVVLGVACGLAALTRAEGALLGPLIAVPLAVGMRALPRRHRLGLVAAVGAASILVVAPWLHHNRTRFHEPVLMTTTAGQSLLLTNRPTTYYGPGLGAKGGYEALSAADVRGKVTDDDESEVDARLRAEPSAYLRANVGRLPVVVVARVARMWGLYRPGDSVATDHRVEGRLRRPSVLSWWTHAAVAPLGLAGLVVLWRRRVPVTPLLALVAAASVTAAINFGLTRYRAGADVALSIAAAVAVVAGARHLVEAVGRRWRTNPTSEVALAGASTAPSPRA